MIDAAKSAEPSQIALLNQRIDELTREVERRRQAEEGLRQSVARHSAMEQRLTTLVEASATLTGTLAPSAVLGSILQLSERLLGADAYAIWRLQASSGRWQIALSSGLSDEFQQGTIRVLERTASMTETPVIADDVFESAILAERREAYRAEGLRSLLAAPLRIHGQVRGTLVLYHRQPHRFSESEVRMAMAVANLSAAALGSADLFEEQARLYDDRRRTEQDSRFLAEASAALAGLVDYESTLQTVARLAVPSFADWCAVDMLDENGSLRRLAVAHVDPSKVELAHELYRRYPPERDRGQSVWRILQSGKSEITPEITDDLLAASSLDAELLRILRELGLKSYMGAPLSVRGKAMGVITFIAAESGRRYDADDLIVAEDLAHRAAIAIDNARLYQALREADRRKDEFLALLGHELRNPLAPISNSLHLLKQPQAGAAVTQRAREVMERQVEHMVRLVDDLLDVSRIMRGKVELRREPVELAAVVARAIETSQPTIDAEGHQLTVSLDPEPVWLHGDLVRLAQVLSNLFNNAAKYTPRGGHIRLTASREAGQGVIRVRDTGVGVPPELLPRLFDMFFQAERHTKESQGGLGIGLSLVRRLVELHGGSVEAHSAGPGGGSEFVVRLPLLARDNGKQARPSRTAHGAEKALATRRVLVVDDNVDAADSLAMLLRLAGQEAQAAYDGPSALTEAERQPPDIAFLDLGMPKMDGYELARAFRADSALRDVTLVALTGWGQPEDRQRTAEAGFDHHLVKPVEAKTLRRLLAERV